MTGETCAIPCERLTRFREGVMLSSNVSQNKRMCTREISSRSSFFVAHIYYVRRHSHQVRVFSTTSKPWIVHGWCDWSPIPKLRTKERK